VATEDLSGRVIGGRYRILSRLGEGGMATAWLAQDQRVNRQVVVKVPHPELLQRADFRKRFQREVQRLTELQHPGIVPLYDCGEEEGLPYCVVRYLPGGDLHDRIEAAGGRLAAPEVSSWLPGIAETLDFVHAAGVLHRDVTPANILFDDAGNAFLSDFGVAAIVSAADEDSESEHESRLTAEGAFVGAAVYAPPEAVYRNLTPAYDQYSLALVLYQTLCGYLPFNQVESRALMMAKNSEAPAPLDQRGVPLPSPAVDAVMRGLAADPAARFPSCRELATAFMDIGDASNTQEIVIPGLRPERRSRRRGLLLGALLTLGLGAAAIWVAFPDWVPPLPNLPTLADRATSPATLAGDGPTVLAGTTRVGTTKSELEGALRLCRAHASDCPASLYDDERPREVTLAPFELDETEVSNDDFALFVAETGHRTTAEQEGFSRDGPFEEEGLQWRHPAGPRSSYQDLPRHPVVHVSARDAEAFCAYAGKRLPTEEEWEYAARGDDHRVFPWGPKFRAGMANAASTGEVRLQPTGSFPPGPFGHLDLVGNVWEWTATYEGSDRVLKGASWMETNPANVRAAVRLLSPPTDHSSDVGFRCASDAAE
jgi:formylglycine-generating enzyme required for sulfatase activity/serine/threonine protein kinase